MDFITELRKYEQDLRTDLIDYINEMLPSVGLFAGVIVAIFIAYKVIKSFLGENERLDTSTLVRPCLTLAALALYVNLIQLLMETPVGLVNDIITDATGADPFDLRVMRDKMAHTQDTGGDEGGGVYDIIQIHPFLEFIHVVIFFLAQIAGGYILFRQLIVKSIYMVLGPFALAFSLVVGNEKVVNSWFQGYISVLLWLPVLSIIQGIMLLIPVESTQLVDEDIIFSVAMQIVMIFTVFKVPQYANILVTQGASMGQQYGETLKADLKSWYNNAKQNKIMKRR